MVVGVKIIRIILKDIRAFMRDYKSFVLLFLTPLFLTLSLGLVYVNSQPTDVPVILCSETGKIPLYQSVRGLLVESDIFTMREEGGDCRGIITESIRASRTRLGIIVFDNLFAGVDDHTIEVIYDNAKPINFFIQSHVSLLSHQMSNELIGSAVGMAHDEINSTIDKIDILIVEAEAYLDVMRGIRERLDIAEDSMDAIRDRIRDMESRMSLIFSASVTMKSSLSSLDQMDQGLESVEGRLLAAEQILLALNASTEEVREARGVINLTRQSISHMNGTLSSARDDIDMFLSSADLRSVREIADAADDTIEETLDDIDGIIREIEASLEKSRSLEDYLKSRVGEVPEYYEEPVTMKMEGLFGNRNFVSFLFPSIIITVLMWMSVFLSSVAFIRQRNQGILKRIAVSPTRTGTIIIEKILLYTIISLIFLPFIVVLGIAAFGLEVHLANLASIVGIYSLSSILFVLIGLIIASLARTENTAILASLMLVIPFMFLSGTFFPYESLPGYIKTASIVMPTTISANLLAGFFFYDLPMETVINMLGLLAAYLGLIFIASWKALSWSIKK